MHTQQKQSKIQEQAVITIPLDSLRCISGYPKEKKIICEINTDKLQKINQPKIIDEMISEARLEYFTGKLKGFKNANDLINDLNN